jgi:hypothetical protein
MKHRPFSAFNAIVSMVIVFILFSIGVYYFNRPGSAYGPQTYGPQTYGPQTYGPQTYGSQPIQPYVYEYDRYSVRPQVTTPPDYNIGIQDKSTDTIRNPYAPPILYQNADYNQMGYLSAGAYKVPLLGKPASNMSRDKWYYYTIQNRIKIPLCKGKRKCTSSQGCDSVSTGDVVLVDNSEYTVYLYDADMN